MMIKKLISIKNIGRLVDSKQHGEELTKFNLFFAENGRGKTTLCGILRSLQTGDANYLLERTTISPSVVIPSANIRLENRNAIFSNGQWSFTLPEIAIFDSVFISQNVYSGEYVNREHRRNLLKIIVGEDGVKFAKKVDELDRAITETTNAISSARQKIEEILDGRVKLEDFVALSDERDINFKIESKQSDLNAARRASEIKSKPFIKGINAPGFPSIFEKILQTTIDEVSQEASKKVRKHIQTNHIEEEWIAKGLEFSRKNKCGFCGQDIKELDLIKAYKDYFSQTYRLFNTEIKKLKEDIEYSFSEAAAAMLNTSIEVNDSLLEFWSEFINVTPLPRQDKIASSITRLRAASLGLITKKLASPLESVEIDHEFGQARNDFKQISKELLNYNNQVKKLNAEIQERKDTIQTADIKQIEGELSRLMIISLRFENASKKACEEYLKNVRIRKELENERNAAKEALDRYSDSTIVNYESTINSFLKTFGASFSITNSKRTYVGDAPASTYQILINKYPIDLGDNDTPLGTPSFRTTMSAGDKSTLALAFFLAQLECDPNKIQRIVVFDDPFNSQDRSRRERTAELLKKYGGSCHQLLLFSHDPLFLKLVFEKLPQQGIRTLQLSRVNHNNTTIEDWDIVKETQDGYFKDHAELNSYILLGGEDLISVARKIRPVLEGYLRYRFPNKFPDKKWLGDMISIVRERGDKHPLFNSLTEIEEINDYSKKFHHETNPGQSDNVLVDDGELRAFVQRVLDIVGGY